MWLPREKDFVRSTCIVCERERNSNELGVADINLACRTDGGTLNEAVRAYSEEKDIWA
jgi:hypothetical protein